ncbi:hypothetical protein AB6A40_008863 [Gnathostoma spinigerum]|uniref:ZP domain-containing protein n=1 Tax=Gnathostoma spinigerum TaxID=75299 RepID=A0ABD6EQA5_9BILA
MGPTFIPILLFHLTNTAIIAEIQRKPPELECLSDGLRLHFFPESPFCGHIYVKGFFLSADCHIDFTSTPFAQPFYFSIPYQGNCNVVRQRSINPSGVMYSVVVMVQHHYLFLTRSDNSYCLNCFYRDYHSKVTQSLEIG